MAPRVDVGVDAERDARAGLPLAERCRSIRSSSPSDSALIVLHAEVDRLRQLGAGLADAGEDDLSRDEAGAQRDVDLPARVRVGAAAESAQQPGDRQRGVRLERVVQRVRMRAKASSIAR